MTSLTELRQEKKKQAAWREKNKEVLDEMRRNREKQERRFGKPRRPTAEQIKEASKRSQPVSSSLGQADRRMLLTQHEASGRVFGWLFSLCGYRRKTVAGRLFGCTDVSVHNAIAGRTIPSPRIWARLCRDVSWRVRAQFHWEVVVDRHGDSLKLADRNVVPVQELPGPLDDLPTDRDLMDWIGFSNYVSRSRVADMIGKRQREPNRETWRRLSEMYLWAVAGYPLQNLASADFRTREATWDSLYMAPQARKGIKGLTLPRDPFEFVALYPVCP